MQDKNGSIPDSTAVRVALWRALHVLIDEAPHVLADSIGLQLIAPDASWRNRPDMHPNGASRFRASIVARARFIEDYISEQVQYGISQYVMLGAGLDTFAQRQPEIASRLTVFELDKPETQAWKRQRIIECGFHIPNWLRFVPVNFEASTTWWQQLTAAGFDKKKSAVVTSIGVSMYLTLEAIQNTLQQMAKLAPGSTFIMTFMLPLELVNQEDQPGYQMAIRGAQASGTPFKSFFSPHEMLAMARDAGFKQVEYQSTAAMVPRYFAGRKDGLRPSTGEELLIART